MTTIREDLVIMQIIPNLGAGGAEQGCIDMAAAIKEAGATSIVVSNGGYRTVELERIGATHIKLPVHSKNPLIMLTNIMRLKRLIKKHNVNIVHVRSRAPAWSAWYACKNNKKCHFMTTCHAPYKVTCNMKRRYNSIITRGARVIAISNYVAQYLKKNYTIDPSIIRTIHRGIPIERFHPSAVSPERMIDLAEQWRVPDGAYVIMLPGRVTRWKGHHVMIEAIEKLDRDDVFCIMIGSDQGRKDYRRELENTIDAKKLGSKVRIVDQCTDMPAAYMLSTIVVSASTEPEGFGRVPVEAQAMGKPVIATDHGGAKETIIPDITGWLIPHSNPEALANAIKEILDMGSTQHAILAARSMEHAAKNFAKKIMTEKTLDVYAELLQKKNL
ncbi:MAG: glycosyltransferase family 4 protein [Alphaproteobacteria bacterium]